MDLDALDALELDVRATSSAERARDWALVLLSAGIAHRVDVGENGIVVVVAAHDGGAGLAALDASERRREEVDVPASRMTGLPPAAIAGPLAAYVAEELEVPPNRFPVSSVMSACPPVCAPAGVTLSSAPSDRSVTCAPGC